MDVDTRPVGPDDLTRLAALFESQRNTRHCWCTAFCLSRRRFAVGWIHGGNRRSFEALANADSTPMGVLASVAGEPVGWCACGPRSRFAEAVDARHSIIGDRDRAEDEVVWLLPCLFVRAEFRGQGITSVLIRAAVQLARREGARAVEGWPLAGPDPAPAEAFLGREKAFAAAGFRCIARPNPSRAIMRLELKRRRLNWA